MRDVKLARYVRDMGTETDATTAANVAELRDARKHTVRTLSALLDELGHPLLPSGITKIEQGQRRVDAGDLVALAVALGVNPNRLLLPASDAGEVTLTPAVTAQPFQVWGWAQGRGPLMPGVIATGHGEETYDETLDDFRRHALPVRERLRDEHTAVRAATDVLDSVRAVLDRRDNPDEYLPETEKARFRPGPNPSLPAGLRARLRRLVAEVDDLIGDDDG